MSANLKRLSNETVKDVSFDSLSSLEDLTNLLDSETVSYLTLASLPVGARLVVRCKKDWRMASISQSTPTSIRINVHSPRGGTYRIHRTPETVLQYDGAIPLLSATDDECQRALWLSDIARYDFRP